MRSISCGALLSLFVVRATCITSPSRQKLNLDNAYSQDLDISERGHGVGFPPSKHLKSRLPSRRMKPLFLHSSGCTGSSIIMDIARDLLELHGINAYMHETNMPQELIIPRKNPFYTPQLGLAGGLKALGRAAEQNHTTLLFKSGGIDVETFEAAVPTLVEMNTTVVFMERSNALEFATCMAHDCFVEEEVGYPVDEHGKKSSMCFARRKANGTSAPTKVFFEREGLKTYLEKLTKRTKINFGANYLQTLGFKNVRTVYAEKLLSYETHSRKGLGDCVHEWRRLLRGWGIEGQKDIIAEYLIPLWGSYKRTSQKSRIYNFGDVRAIVSKVPEWKWMLRDH